MRLRRAFPLVLAVATLTGCPEERADAKRPLPRERLPPAMPVQPRAQGTLAPTGVATPSPDGQDAALPAGGAAPQPAPDATATPGPTRTPPAR